MLQPASISLTPVAPAAEEAAPHPPFGLIAASLLCAFGFWFTPAILVVYALLTSWTYHPVEGFVLLSLAALAAAAFRLVLGDATDHRRDRERLLVVLLALVLSNVVCLWLLREGLGYPPRLYMLAVVSGVGGGSFVSLYQQGALRRRGHSPEAPLIMAHLGIVMALLVVPLLLILPNIGGSGDILLRGSSHFLGRTETGSTIEPAWPPLVWLLWSLVLLVWAGVVSRVHPLSHAFCLQCLARLLLWLAAMLTVVLGLWMLGADTLVLYWLLLAVLANIAGRPGAVWWREGVPLGSRAWLWPLGLGSFLGLSAAFPLLTLTVFYGPHQPLTVAYPAIFLYAWMLPLGSTLMRPVGYWAARRWGVKHLVCACIGAQVTALLSVAWWIYCANMASYSPQYFPPYLFSFAVLFVFLGLASSTLEHSAKTPPGRPAMAALGMAMVSLLMASLVERIYLAPLILAGGFAVCGMAYCLPTKRARATSM